MRLNLIFLLTIVLTLTSCSTDKVSTIKYNIPTSVISLDPQFSTSTNQRTIIYNTFEGLMRYNEDNNIINGAAKDYNISRDGLTYTFNLKDDLKWSDQTPVTAHDYVFGIQRIFTMPNPSPFAKEFISIENAKTILSGTMSAINLGVSAKDDKTIIIKLQSPNPNFLSLMTHTASMPCKESFFIEQKGKYAIAKSTILSNGVFKIERWNKNQILLYPSEDYHTQMNISPLNINMGSSNNLIQSDIELISYGQTQSDIGNNYQEYFLDSWSIIMNSSQPLFEDFLVRQTLMGVIDRNHILSMVAPPLSTSDSFVPPDAMIDGVLYSSINSKRTFPVPIAEPKKTLYAKLQDNELSRFPKTTIIVPNMPIFIQIGNYIQRQFMDELSIYANLEMVPIGDISNYLTNGNYQIIVAPTKGLAGNCLTYLTSFSDMGYKNSGFLQAVSNAGVSILAEESARYIAQAEQILIDENISIPLLSTPSRMIWHDSVSGVNYLPLAGIIDFSKASKK